MQGLSVFCSYALPEILVPGLALHAWVGCASALP